MFVLVVPPDTHTAKYCLNPSKRAAVHSFSTFHKFHFVHSFPSPHLPNPQKKLHYTAKSRASPAVNGSRPQPSFRYRYIAGYLLPPPSLHSQRLRLSLNQPSKNFATLRILSSFFRSAQGCFTCSVFRFAYAQPPTTHPKRQLKIVVKQPYRVEF